MRLQVALPALVVAVLLAAFAVVGCGSGDDSKASDASPAELLNATFSGDTSIRSGDLTLALDADVQGVAQPVALKLSGPFQSSGSKTELPKFAFQLSVTTSGATQRIGATSTGEKGFLSYEGVDYAVPDDLFKQFADGYRRSARESGPQGGATPSLKSLGIDPLNWLTDPRKAGETDVGATKTVHMTAGIDVPKLLGDVRTAAAKVSAASGQSQLSAADVDELAKSVKSAKVDIYTGAQDEKLRKFVLDLQLTTGHVKLTLQFDELNQPQDITAPEDAKSITGLLSALGAAAPAPSGSSSSQRYLECVQAAGNDIAKLQACAKYAP